MRVPLAWLAEWVDLPADADLLAERLTLGGLEVEDRIPCGPPGSSDHIGPELSGVRVGRVAECGPHPNADRLRLCRVDLGNGDPLEIVCGAPNVAEGQRVAVGLPGTVLADGTRLKKSKIRGVVSHGMICSEQELGIGEDAAGILVLPENAPIGAALSEVLEPGDVALEVAIPPNRGDTASMIGIAREVRAQFGGAIREPARRPPETSRDTGRDIRIEIEDPKGCYRYVARVVRNVGHAATPEPIVRKLEAAGLRSISLVVDVTNLVLLEFGQPIHAFDLSTIRGGVIRVRAALAGERIRTLDGHERILEPEDLVIADAERAVAIAGVMGGAETEVRADTTGILIESAHFDPSRVRRTARRLGLQTEASYRFERGVDRAGIQRAADRAATLLAELAGGEVSSEPIVAVGSEPPSTTEIVLEPSRVDRILGTELGTDEIVSLLDRVGVACETGSSGALRCRIPTHRNDLHLPEDLIEEVVRTHGCDRIPRTLPFGELRAVRLPESWSAADRTRDSLCAAGLLETVSLPFLDRRLLDRLRIPEEDPRRQLVALQNPMAEEEGWLRPLLIPTLLSVSERNRARQVEAVRLYEVSHVFHPRGADLPLEPLHVAALVVRGSGASLWDPADPPPVFFEMKGIAERLLMDLGRPIAFSGPSAEPFLHPAASCGVTAGGRAVGFVGEIHPDVAMAFGIDGPCGALEIDLSGILGLPEILPQFEEVSRQPRVRRDLAVLVDRDRPAGEILEAIRKAGGSSLVRVEIFDRYTGRGVPEDKVSLAFRLVFQRPDRTLTDAEVAKQWDRIVRALAKRFGAALRSGGPEATSA